MIFNLSTNASISASGENLQVVEDNSLDVVVHTGSVSMVTLTVTNGLNRMITFVPPSLETLQYVNKVNKQTVISYITVRSCWVS